LCSFLLHTAFVPFRSALQLVLHHHLISSHPSIVFCGKRFHKQSNYFLCPSWIAPIAASLIQQPILGGINVRDNPFCARTFLAQFAMLFVHSNPTSFVITKRSTLWKKTRFPYQLCALRGKRNLESLVPLVARP
jgi:hypothetical protein